MFSTDSNGSLPEVSVVFQNEKDRLMALRTILENSKVTENSIIYLENQDIKCLDLGFDKLVNSLNTSHHINVTEFKSLPELGVGIFENGIAIDFRTGREWSEEAVEDFMELLYIFWKVNCAKKICLDEEGICFSQEEIDLFNSLFFS